MLTLAPLLPEQDMSFCHISLWYSNYQSLWLPSYLSIRRFFSLPLNLTSCDIIKTFIQVIIHFLDTAPWVSSLPETFTDCGRHRHKAAQALLFWTLSSLVKLKLSLQAFPPWREFLVSLRVEIPASGNSLIAVSSISTLSATCTHYHFLTLCLRMKTYIL